jgi:hypothetical protein
MEQTIEGMSDTEILAFLNEYNRGVENKILDFNNEYDFTDEALFNIIVAIEYLIASGLNENADDLFSNLLNKSQIELTNRLGNLPRTE